VVVRLGEQRQADLAGAGYRRILQGQTLHLHTISDTAVTIRAWARVIYDTGQGQLLTIPEVPRSASLVAEDLLSTDVVIHDGWVVNAEVEMVTPSIKRGQAYVRLTVEPFGAALLSDYCFSEFGHVSLGTFVPPGPAGGSGNLSWVAVKANAAPTAAFTYTLAISNKVRLFREFSWLYSAAGGGGGRILTLRIQTLGAGLPTGYGASGNQLDFWVGSTLTLTGSQDGYMFAGPLRSGIQDNGTLTIDDNSTDPTPFPIWIPEDSTLTVRGELQNEESGDFDVMWGLFEDWVLL